MRFLPTLDVWDPAINQALRNGQLRLQVGQWIRCGQQRPSRFVAVRPRGTIWAVHPQGERGCSLQRFRSLLAANQPRSQA